MGSMEKVPAVEVPSSSATSSIPEQEHHVQQGGVDKAYDFLASAQGVIHENVNLGAIRRKVDWRIVPIMFACYTMQFLDKVLINYAAVMGLTKNLGLKGNQFANTSTFFYVATVLFEIPTGYILNKVPAGKWLGANVILWGIATTCTAAAHSYETLLTARIFLGIFESAIAPCLMLICSQWYTKTEQPPRYSFWYCAIGFGQIVGGLTSFGFQHVTHASLEGWKIMFIVIGLITVLIGIWTFLCLPDSPLTVGFLSKDEKAALLHHISVNQTGVVGRQFKASQIVDLLTDPQTYLLAIMTIVISIPSGITTTFSSTLLANMGYTPKQATLLQFPSGFITITAVLGGGFAVRHTSNRWAWIIFFMIPSIIAGALMGFVPTTHKGGVLAGIYLINPNAATLPIIYQWVASNISGHTKRSAMMSLAAACYSIGNCIGPQTFQSRDAPQYIPAKITVMVGCACAALLSFTLMLYYKFINKSRDGKYGVRVEASLTDEDKWDNLTDRENKTFRYVY